LSLPLSYFANRTVEDGFDCSRGTALKIALIPMGSEAWIAGEITVRNIIDSVRELNDPFVTMSIISGDDAVREKYQSVDEFICYTKPRRYDLRAG
jgi:hypothetical protein